VTDARWRTIPRGGSALLRTPTKRVSIEFGTFEREAIDSIIDHLRLLIDLDVQTNWNLFAYKIADPSRRPTPTKPGPDEVLLRQSHWDRFLVPGVGVAAIVGVGTWWSTDELRFLAAPVFPILFWVMMRRLTPTEGMITRRLTFSADTEFSRWLLFSLLWALVAFGGVMTVEALRPRLRHPDTVLILGMAVWLSVLLFKAFQSDRRGSRRDREAADLAAKERGEENQGPSVSSSP
jgi:hypothetical protein